jgi:hypothetical protein
MISLLQKSGVDERDAGSDDQSEHDNLDVMLKEFGRLVC